MREWDEATRALLELAPPQRRQMLRVLLDLAGGDAKWLHRRNAESFLNAARVLAGAEPSQRRQMVRKLLDAADRDTEWLHPKNAALQLELRRCTDAVVRLLDEVEAAALAERTLTFERYVNASMLADRERGAWMRKALVALASRRVEKQLVAQGHLLVTGSSIDDGWKLGKDPRLTASRRAS